MKMTVGEIVRKLDEIDVAVETVQTKIDHDCYDSLEDVVELLAEYRSMIRAIVVDIPGV